MQSLAVIKHGDILQYILLCFIPGLVVSPLATFPFEATKKALSNRIVPAISQTTHATNETVCFQ
jgi:hypothetical protein